MGCEVFLESRGRGDEKRHWRTKFKLELMELLRASCHHTCMSSKNQNSLVFFENKIRLIAHIN
jgi:hypothetical protein